MLEFYYELLEITVIGKMDIFTYLYFLTATIIYSSAQPDYNLMMHINKTEDFAKFIVKNGRPFNISEYMESDDYRQVVGGLEDTNLATFDPCSPRYQTVVIQRDRDPNVFYWPPCTRVLRCGGCCPAEMLSCEPIRTSIKRVLVVRSRIEYPGSPEYLYDGGEIKLIEQHDQCEPQCKVKPENCNLMQEYVAHDCRCVCRNRVQCPSTNHVWDEDTCTCKCAQILDKCPRFSRFSESSCICELRQVVSGLTREEMDYLRELARQMATTSPPPLTLPPTLNLQGSSCQPTHPCPPGIHASMFGGMCLCMLPQRLSLPPNRGRRNAQLKRLLMNINKAT